MFFTCPSCQMSLQADPESVGRVVNCPGCGLRMQIPELAGETAAGGKKRREGWPESDPSNVNLWIALGLGMGAMVVVVGILALVRNSFVGQVFFTGGWVNYAEFVLFFWGLGILFLKIRKTRHQRDALLLDVLPDRLGQRINATTVGKFVDHLYGLPAHLRDSMMVNHIRKGLELFEVRGSNSEVASLLDAQSAIDANKIGSSYALLKVFLWAIPILGFIGTVLGLSFAMAGFGAADLTNMDALKGAVTSITSGLATAFNTTLLGLILSMLLIFPMSSIQKLEEDTLNNIDAFCNEVLLPRLDDSGAGAGGGLGNVPQLVEQIAAGITASQREFLAEFNNSAEIFRNLAGELQQAAAAHQQKVEEQFTNTMTELTSRTNDAVGAVSKSVAELTGRTGTAVEKSADSASRYLEALNTGIQGLNDVLGKLGEKRVVVQNVRTGWWPFGGKKS
jgi:flagellar motor component MotA